MDRALPHRPLSGMAIMRIGIDFAPRSLWPRPRDLALLAGALLALSAAVWSVYNATSARRAAAGEIQQLRTTAQRAQRPLDPAMVAAVNQAIRQLNLPWENLLSSVEAATNEQISLLALEPDADQRVLRLSGEAKTAADMIDFVERIGHVGFFASATLLRHEINESDRNRPFRFVLEAAWSDE